MELTKNSLSKFVAVPLLTVLLLGSASFSTENVSAAEIENEDNVLILTDEVTEFISDNKTRATVTITGTLRASDPILKKPRANAETKTSSNVSSIRAKADSNNNGTGTSTTGWKVLNNTRLVNSGVIPATTTKAIFTGYHGAKLSSGSNWSNTKNTSLSY